MLIKGRFYVIVIAVVEGDVKYHLIGRDLDLRFPRYLDSFVGHVFLRKCEMSHEY
ncbi:hypothetical protein D9M69_680950 [compost metagenome]